MRMVGFGNIVVDADKITTIHLTAQGTSDPNEIVTVVEFNDDSWTELSGENRVACWLWVKSVADGGTLKTPPLTEDEVREAILKATPGSYRVENMVMIPTEEMEAFMRTYGMKKAQ